MHGWKTALTVPQRERVKDIFAYWCSDQITSNVMLWKNVHPQWELSKINWVFRLATGNPSISLPALHVHLGWRWRLIKPLIHSHVHVIGYVPYWHFRNMCCSHLWPDFCTLPSQWPPFETALQHSRVVWNHRIFLSRPRNSFQPCLSRQNCVFLILWDDHFQVFIMPKPN